VGDAPEDTATRERRFLRLIREAEHVPVPPQALNPLEQRILKLERDLTLVSMSRLYRLGKVLRRGVNRVKSVRREPAVADVPEAAPEPTARALPPGTGRPVIFFVPWLVHGGGGERVVSDLAQGLVADGRTVAVFVTARTPQGMPDATDDMLGVTPHVLDFSRLADDPERVSYCKPVVQTSDAVLVNVGSEWFYEHLGELRSGRTKVVDTLFNHVGHVRNSVANASQIDTSVAAHESLARVLVDYYQVPNEVRTIYVGVEPRGPAPPRPQDAVPVVGWLGRLSREKRPAWFVELARRVGDAARFRLAGDGPDAAAVKATAAGVPSLEVLGFVDDNIGFIDGCDLIAITSDVEGISVVAMEAISRGVPVVSTDVGGMPDLIQPGVNGELVSADDFEELVECVQSLVEDRETLRALQDSVRSTGLEQRFTRDAMLADFRKILT
jgi:glycosyltransferase involved in cell wall biosynthesis